MRNLGLSILLVLVLGGGFYLASPIWALDGLRSAIEAGDAVELEDRVDFPAVRESLKAEINAQVIAGLASEVSENAFGVLAMGIASKMLDVFVEAAVTPAGLARMARGDSEPVSPDGREPRRPGRAPAPGEDPEDDGEKLFRNARLERETLSRFSVWVPDEDGDELRFVFRRTGLSWRLTSIELPTIESSDGSRSR